MKSTNLEQVIVTNLVDLLPAWKRYLGILFDKIPTGKVERTPGVYSFKSLLKNAPLENPPEIDGKVFCRMGDYVREDEVPLALACLGKAAAGNSNLNRAVNGYPPCHKHCL